MEWRQTKLHFSKTLMLSIHRGVTTLGLQILDLFGIHVVKGVWLGNVQFSSLFRTYLFGEIVSLFVWTLRSIY